MALRVMFVGIAVLLALILRRIFGSILTLELLMTLLLFMKVIMAREFMIEPLMLSAIVLPFAFIKLYGGFPMFESVTDYKVTLL